VLDEGDSLEDNGKLKARKIAQKVVSVAHGIIVELVQSYAPAFQLGSSLKEQMSLQAAVRTPKTVPAADTAA
jgi:hypothetical protein